MKILYPPLCCLTVSILCVIAGGCARSVVPDLYTSASNQQENARKAQNFRTMAYSFTEMADRRQIEAEMLAQKLGDQDPRVEEKRHLATELRAAARDADYESRSFRQHVPHAMVQ